MSSIGGPNNIRDGLVLFVDASNSKSFRGEPTVNNANQTLVNESNTSKTNINVIGPEGKTITANKITINASSGVCRMIMYNLTPVIPTQEQYYTISCWVKKNNSINVSGGWESELDADPVYSYARPGVEIGYTGVYGAHPNTQTIPSEWTRIAYTFKYSIQPTVTMSHYFYFSGLGGEVLFYGLQFEGKNYATPFVIGTRGTTVATGGGLIDLSKNSNNGELVNGPYYSSANSGSLIFDGADDYISINSPSDKFAWTPSGSGNNSMTLDLWVKSTDTSGYYISKPWNGSGEYNYYIKDSEFQIVIGYGAGHTLYRTFSSMATGKWENVTVVFTPTQTGIYRNGVIDAPLSNHGIIYNTPDNGNTNLDLCLMTLYPYETSFDYPTFSMSGNLSTFKVYNKSLSASEVLQNYNASKSRFGL